ncbi:helix-turn-helix transcriptional regulator [Prolixibacteraceae bacterium Z1-6]|uniref:Helix-turn-helix transcriptional regulator n=1 Tax=Draconibacterium aestuarii TaxID=2998507 RepID=A0A9X3J419_9BACT|nr:helix-turn-helix transcriptional regulator [Prolixibacteraceae bacterium Z1-6]
MIILKNMLFKPANFYMVLYNVKTDFATCFEVLQIQLNESFNKLFVHIDWQLIIHKQVRINSQDQKNLKYRSSKRANEIRSEKYNEEFVKLIRKAIIENMKVEGFGVRMLCKKVGISRTQLHIKLKSFTNRSTSHYIRFVRIKKACQLLRETYLNITQVASEIGIDSLPYFSRIFRAEVGLSPQEYRKIYRLEQ